MCPKTHLSPYLCLKLMQKWWTNHQTTSKTLISATGAFIDAWFVQCETLIFIINCIDNRLYNIVHQVITFVKFYDIFHNAKICQHIFRDFYSSIIQFRHVARSENLEGRVTTYNVGVKKSGGASSRGGAKIWEGVRPPLPPSSDMPANWTYFLSL